ncbi:hypothetical protein IAU60_000427 [Kwoniella sp. DSM 27419]
MSANDNTIILITGGNTGIGYATAQALLLDASKRYTIIITSRSISKSTSAAEQLRNDPDHAKAIESGSEVVPVELDIDSDESAKKVHDILADKYGRIDVLVNNAGIHYDYEIAAGKVSTRDGFNKAFATNVASTHALTEALVDLLLKSPKPRILFISSSLASLENHSDDRLRVNQSPPAGWPKPKGFNATTYRTSKTAMNMMILEWIRILKNDKVKVHCVDPGLLVTNLGGADKDMLRAIGAQEPIVAGEFIKSVAEGARDADQGKMVKKDGLIPW